MKDYQQLKTEALEAFSQHGKAGQKITISGSSVMLRLNENDRGRINLYLPAADAITKILGCNYDHKN